MAAVTQPLLASRKRGLPVMNETPTPTASSTSTKRPSASGLRLLRIWRMRNAAVGSPARITAVRGPTPQARST
jgi:hypothetical protein